MSVIKDNKKFKNLFDYSYGFVYSYGFDYSYGYSFV